MALGNFELDIARFVAKAKGNTDLVVRKIALDLFSRVIEKSPVDTGRFKGNWQAAIDSIPPETLAYDAGMAASITRVEATALEAKAGDIVYLVNNLDYARALEYGHSKQAPGGMVRTTVQEYGAVVTKAASEVPK